MSKSCFLSLPSDNLAGMKCGFRNSCPTWPNRASWRKAMGTHSALKVAAVAAPAGGIKGQKFSRGTGPQEAQHSELPLGPRDWTISPRQHQGPCSRCGPGPCFSFLVTPAPKLPSLILPVKNSAAGGFAKLAQSCPTLSDPGKQPIRLPRP